MSERFQYILIGGYAAANAAQAIRQKDANASILLVTAEQFPPYDRPPLSKQFLWDESWSPEDTFSKPNDFYEKNNVSLKTDTRVTAIDRVNQTLILDNGGTLEYGKLLLAPGAEAKLPDIPGAKLPNVYAIRKLTDSLGLREAMKSGEKAVVVGGSYLGLETASGCAKRGIDTTVIDSHDGPWSKFASPQLQNFLISQFDKRGVKFLFGERMETINTSSDGSEVTSVETKDGPVACDFLVLATGAKLNSNLAKEAGLDVDEKFGIVVDKHYQTSDPNIWAAGDCIHYPDPVVGKMWHNEHYTNAQWSGSIAGANMTGATEKLEKAPYFFSDVLDFHMVLRGNPAGGKAKSVLGSMDDAEFVELYADEEDTVKMALAISRDDKKTNEVAEALETLVLNKKKTAEVTSSDLGSFLAPR